MPPYQWHLKFKSIEIKLSQFETAIEENILFSQLDISVSVPKLDTSPGNIHNLDFR